jgi:hypothetical protein
MDREGLSIFDDAVMFEEKCVLEGAQEALDASHTELAYAEGLQVG